MATKHVRVIGMLVAGMVLPAVAPLSAQQAVPQATASGPTVSISMEQAVTMAMESNLGLRSDRIGLDLAAQQIAAARTAFLPSMSSSLSRGVSRSQPVTNDDGTQSVASRTNVNGGAGFGQVLPWFGGSYSANWSASRSASSGGGSFNPQLGSSIQLSFRQPLWRNFKIDGTRAGLETSERNRVISELNLQQQVFGLEVQVRNAYLTLVGAIENRNVAQKNLELAETQQRNARARVAVGVAPQVEIINQDVAVARQRDALITAETSIATEEDNLRALILDPGRSDFWTVRITPTDTIQVTERQIDVDAAIKNALASRLDIVVQRRNLEITDLNMKVSRNATLPQVDFSLGYSSSGAGGRSLSNGESLYRGFGNVLGDAFGAAYPSWSAGVNVSYPIGHTGAEIALTQAELRKRQQEIALRESEMAIVRSVRDAARQVDAAFRRLDVSLQALAASQAQLDAEDRKFQVGLSAALDLQNVQLQLTAARVNELGARISYNRALINFDRVQKIQ